ncbi:hypothetical protein P879_08836 [Paragonimus westermani]|uniref:Protein kinase domain-containing protein n=1 Tax=Paragonimus westermani TaxID=34504 RepID=A0A8T0D2A7_9TREM|nr:hypothetical protein P879_08836 [Paragonimus westermani]
MLTALIGRTIIIIFGVLHPSYKTYKALRRKDYQEVVVLGMYWVVFSMFTTLELFTDIFFQWFPFYHELKILFVIWLVAPTTAGYSLIYRRLIHPELSKRENDIDEAINKATEKGYNKVVEFGAKGLNYAAKTFISTALMGHEFLTDQLRRRSSSMIELNRPTTSGNAINRHSRSRLGAGDHRDHPDGPYMFGSDPHQRIHSAYTANVNSGEDDPFALHWLQSGSTGSLGRQWKPPILKATVSPGVRPLFHQPSNLISMGNSLCSKTVMWDAFLSDSQSNFFLAASPDCPNGITVAEPLDTISVWSRLSLLSSRRSSVGLVSGSVADSSVSLRASIRPSNRRGMRDRLDLLQLLGSGSFGSVYLARDRISHKLYALKSMRKDQLVHANHIAHVNQERDILSRLDMVFVAKLLFTFQDPVCIYLAMEFVDGGDLFELLRQHGRLVESTARFYAAQVFMALEYLHCLSVLYRDLKLENIVLGSNGYVKLVDFGFAKFVPRRTYTLCGTPEYIAPEMIMHRGYGRSVDWWAFGILIYEMLFGFTPFHSDQMMTMYENIVTAHVTYPSAFHVSWAACDLIGQLIQVDLSKRLGVLKRGPLDIRDHAWFTSINWDALFNCRVKPPHLLASRCLTDVPEDSEHPLETVLPGDTSATVTTQRRPHTISEVSTGRSTRRVSRLRTTSQPHGVKSQEVNVH